MVATMAIEMEGPMISKRWVVAAVVAAFVTALFAPGVGLTGSGRAQSYPSKPIKLILPYTPGSPNDVLARLVAPPLSARLGQPVVIDNRPGGGTTIGAKAVMAAEPDGHTLLFTNTPTHAIAPLISKSATFDPIHDFVPIATVGSTILVLVIGPSVPAGTVQEFVSHAKANPGKLNFGFGRGTLPHLVGEMFKAETGADITSIPYKGGAQAVTDILGGQIHMNLGATVTLVPLIRAGQVKALAVTGTARHADLPEVPTMIESGLPNVTTVTYYGFMGPAGTPAGVVNRLNNDVNEVLKSPELQASMAKLGFEPKSGLPQEFAALLAEQVQKWPSVVKRIGFQMD
jgi:tripartite-type tricarboxylate transporter receptor subunit TctC